MLIKSLSQPDEELEEKQIKLNKAKQKIERKLESLGDDIRLAYSGIIRKGRNDMEDEVDSACRKINHAIDNLGRTAGEDAIQSIWNSTFNILKDRTLKRCVIRISDEAKRQIDKCVREFCEETEGVLLRFIDNFESRDFMKRVSASISEELDNYDVSSSEICIEKYFDSTSLLGKTWNFITGNDSVKRELHALVEDARKEFDPEPFLESLITRKTQIIDLVKRKIIDDLISPMQSQIEEILSGNMNKEQQLAEATEKQKDFVSKLTDINSAFASIFGK